MSRSTSTLLGSVLAGFVLAQPVHAQGPSVGSDNPILLQNSVVAIRKSDYEQELERIPENIRPGFANSEARINDLLRRLLLERTLAVQAREQKLDQIPANAARVTAEIDRLQAQLMVAKIEADATAEFEAKRPLWEARAKELYGVDRKRYATPEQFNAAHILFKTDRRSPDEAHKLAREARAKVVAGADFNQLARDTSEDATAKRNAGRLDWFAASEMDPGFAAGVAVLKSPGDVSEPVLSSFGWHVIKLEGRRPAAQKSYDEVREQILGELKQKYINEQREAAIAKLRNDPTIHAHREAIDALVVRVDRDAVRRAVQQSAPGAMAPPSK